MMGLLARARQLRTTLGFPPDDRDEFAFDPDSGISREEQTEIRAEIEKVATRSRIAVSPEVFVVRAAKRGILFPIMVIACAVIAVAAGWFLFNFLFQRGETQLARENTTAITAEGKLIQELQKEAESKLQEKNQQINQIQSQLAQIDKQRQDLQAGMDAKIRDRESQLRASMATELEAEKARLQKQGLSDQDIQKRLASLESQQNAAFSTQLEAFRAQADADRRKSEATLRDLQGQFNASLAKANAERQQVLADSKQREADLQAQLTQKTKELQSAQAQTQEQLQALTTQKQQEDLVAQQLVGLYSVAQADIAAKNYQKALLSLQAIGSYVNSPEVITLPTIAKRRSVDLFIVDSLTSLVQGQIEKGSADTTSLVNAANQIADIRSRVSEADGALRAGRIPDAERLYGQALAVIPEVARSYAWFTARSRDAETARQAALRAGLSRAESAFDAGRYPESLSAYREALAFLPETPARLDRILSNIGAAGSAQASQKTQAEQSRAAAPLLTQANALLKQGRSSDALAQFLSILATYPLSTAAAPAVKGISDSAAGMNGQADSRLTAREKELSDQVAALQKNLSGRANEIVGIKKSLMGLLGMTGDPATADTAAIMDALQSRFGDMAGAQGASGDLGTRLAKAQESARLLQVKIDQLSAENERLRAGLPAGQSGGVGVSLEDAKRLSDLDALVSRYRAYAQQEDAIIRSQGEERGRMRTIGLRDSFLGSLDGLFRGMLDRIHHYDDRFVQDSIAQGKDEGRQDALQQAIAVVMDLNQQTTPEMRTSYFKEKIKAADKDPGMKAFLKTLQGLASALP
jgi:hypothetical protein